MKYLITILLCVFFCLEAISQTETYNPSSKFDSIVELGIKAPNFKVTTLENVEYNLENIKDTVVVINFWFRGCKPCIFEIPDLNDIELKYRNTKVIFIAISVYGNESTVKKFLENTPFSYKIVVSDFSIAKDYFVRSYPTHIVISKKDNIIFGKVGGSSNTLKQLDEAIDKALKEE